MLINWPFQAPLWSGQHFRTAKGREANPDWDKIKGLQIEASQKSTSNLEVVNYLRIPAPLACARTALLPIRNDIIVFTGQRRSSVLIPDKVSAGDRDARFGLGTSSPFPAFNKT